MPRKGQTRTFPLSVVVAISSGRNLFPDKPVNMLHVAEVNEFLFPKSGVCMGLLVTIISQEKSKPEILRQHPIFEDLTSSPSLPVDKFFELVGSDRVELTSTGE